MDTPFRNYSSFSVPTGNTCKNFPGSPNSDRLIWTLSTNGEVTSKDIFNEYIRRDTNKPWWRFIWRSFILPRYSIHTWKVLHKRISTDDNLKKNVVFFMASRCRLCNAEEETMDHIFVNCHFSKSLWLFFFLTISRGVWTFQGILKGSFLRWWRKSLALKFKFFGMLESFWFAGLFGKVRMRRFLKKKILAFSP